MSLDLSSIRAVVFDLGGVLIDVDRGRCFERWSAASGRPSSVLSRDFRIDSVYEQHERGEIPFATFARHNAIRLHLELPPAKMQSGWNAIIGAPLADAARAVEVATRRWPGYLLTNTDPLHVEVWRNSAADVLAPLTHQFVSCEIGLRKPSLECYRHIVDAIGEPPSSILFFDDLAENVAAARRAGLTSYRVQGPGHVLSFLGDN